MKLLHISRDALALGAALVADCFVLDLGLMGWDTYPLIAASQTGSADDWFDHPARRWLTTCWAPLLAPLGPTPPTPGVIQLDVDPLPSPMLQRRRNSC